MTTVRSFSGYFTTGCLFVRLVLSWKVPQYCSITLYTCKTSRGSSLLLYSDTWNIILFSQSRRARFTTKKISGKILYFDIVVGFNAFNTKLRTGDADLRFYITTVQDGWCKSAFLTRACFPCTIHLIMQYIEPLSEWSCWRIFIETWPHSELNFRHRASSI
jgi:hypothetical protein